MYVDRRFHSAAGVVFSLLTAATMLAQIQPQASDSDKAIIREIKVGEESGAALVRVTGDGVLTLHTERLSGPDRLVLDFANAHLGGVRQAIPGGVGPVRAIRAGQFKPDVARVVVDMESTVPYRIEPGVGSITVVFGAKDIASAQAAPIPKPQAAQVVGTPMMTGAANAPTSPKAARATPTPSLVRASPGILAPSATTTPASLQASGAQPGGTAFPAETGNGLPNSFQTGLLTFRAKDQPLKVVLDDIGNISNVAIIVAKDVGSEHVSAEFRSYRLDEALRQILKDYDVVFSYGSNNDNQGNPALRTVWVYAPNHGPGMGRFAMTAWNKSDREYQQEAANAGPDERARAVDELIRRDGRDAVSVLMEALKDPSDKVRYQALYRAVLVGALPPEDTIIDLVLNDSSEQVRVWAFQTLPLDPTLRWVALRAASDPNQQIAELARNYLKDLDASVGTAASASSPPAPTQ